MKTLYVIKIGGETLDENSSLQACISACIGSKKNILLVHGGGKKVTELSSRLGIEQKMIEGRRITPPETLDICTMVYAGLINKKIVALFSKFGAKAIGLCGADAQSIISERRKHPHIDYGEVGEVKNIDSSFFVSIIDKKLIPVVCSISMNGEGDLLNTNADTMACEIAQSLSHDYRVHLIYCFEKNGVLRDVMDENSTIEVIFSKDFEEMKSTRQIAGGMIPKLDNAFAAVSSPVEEVRIVHSGELSKVFMGKKTGTEIVI
ncbi:MAG: acetylglutamate kinase [Bergeyella sp.]|nr:acetylglutamate kinase [Bergeyella sp.]